MKTILVPFALTAVLFPVTSFAQFQPNPAVISPNGQNNPSPRDTPPLRELREDDGFGNVPTTSGYSLYLKNNTGGILKVSSGQGSVIYNQHELIEGSQRLYWIGNTFKIEVKNNPNIKPLIIEATPNGNDRYDVLIRNNEIVLDS